MSTRAIYPSSRQSGPHWQDITHQAHQANAANKNIEVPSTGKRSQQIFPIDCLSIHDANETSHMLLSSLRNYFHNAIKDIEHDLSPLEEEEGGMKNLSNHAWENICKVCEDSIQNNDLTSMTIHKLNIAAHQELQRIRDCFQPEYQVALQRTAPQFYLIPSSGDWTVLKPLEAPKNLVCSSGGPKGVGYPNLMETLETIKRADGKNLREGLDAIAGSSAGSIVAALIACNVTAHAAQKLVNEQSLIELISKEPSRNDFKNMKDVSFNGIGLEVTFLIEAINHELIESIDSFLRNHLKFQALANDPKPYENIYTNINDLNTKLANPDKEKLSADEKIKLFNLFKKIDQYKHPRTDSGVSHTENTVPLITFEHLRILRKIDPNKFKDLTITACDTTNKKVVYLNAESASDMPIALAARVSSSLPMFQTITYKGNSMIDGGFGSRMPSELFIPEHQNLIERMPDALKNSHNVQEQLPDLLLKNNPSDNNYEQTLIIGFNLNGQLNDVPSKEVTLAGSFLGTLVRPAIGLGLGVNNFGAGVTSDNVKSWSLGSNAFTLPSGTLTGSSFFASETYKKAVQLQAQSASLEYFFNRHQEASYQSSPTLEAAMDSLSRQEIEQTIHFYNTDKVNDYSMEKVRQELRKIHYNLSSVDQEDEHAMKHALKNFYGTIRSAAQNALNRRPSSTQLGGEK